MYSEAKINGHTFVNLNETKLERLKVSVGFSMLIPDVIEELVGLYNSSIKSSILLLSESRTSSTIGKL